MGGQEIAFKVQRLRDKCQGLIIPLVFVNVANCK